MASSPNLTSRARESSDSDQSVTQHGISDKPRPRRGFMPPRKGSGGLAGLISGVPQHTLGLLVLVLVLTPVSMNASYKLWIRSFLRAPVCRPQLVSGKGLPKFIILLGPEGGGHDLFEYIFAALPTPVAIERFDPNFHLTASRTQQTSAANAAKTEFCPKLPYAKDTHDFGAQITSALSAKTKDSAMYVRVRDPFPMGRIRTPLARPDPVALGTFHGLYYDLKAIVLVRNLTKVAQWSILRNFHGNDVGLQLRLLEDSLTYLDASLRALPCSTVLMVNVDQLQVNQEVTVRSGVRSVDCYSTVSSVLMKGAQQWLPCATALVVNVDQFQVHQEAAARQLARFLDLKTVTTTQLTIAIQVALSRWAEAGQAYLEDSRAQPTFAGQRMDYYFAQRSGLWPLLSSVKSVFLPKSPLAWP